MSTESNQEFNHTGIRVQHTGHGGRAYQIGWAYPSAADGLGSYGSTA